MLSLVGIYITSMAKLTPASWNCAGALVAATGHFAGTAKLLQEEGVDTRARVRAIPMAVGIYFYPENPKHLQSGGMEVMCARRSWWLGILGEGLWSSKNE
jgi:hypothetical protein